MSNIDMPNVLLGSCRTTIWLFFWFRIYLSTSRIVDLKDGETYRNSSHLHVKNKATHG